VAPPPGGQADDQRRRPTEVIWIWVRAGVYGLGTTAGHGEPKKHREVDEVRVHIDPQRHVAHQVTSAVLTPTFLVADTFFPISTLDDSEWLRPPRDRSCRSQSAA
jgi:hypothetical protein